MKKVRLFEQFATINEALAFGKKGIKAKAKER